MTVPLAPERIIGGTDLTVQLPAGTMRFQECRREQWLTLKGEPAKKEHRGYWLDRGDGPEPLDSVSDIAGSLARPALERWMQRHAAIGGAHAERLGELEGVPDEDIFDRVTMLGLGPEAARGQGAARGNAIHVAMHSYVTTGAPPDPEDYPVEWRPWLTGATRAVLALDPEPIAVERIVCHPELLYAGRFDLYAICGGQRTLVDFKSGRGLIHSGAHWQTRGYAECFSFCEMEPPERILILGIDDHGGFELVECDKTPEEWCALVTVFRSNQRTDRLEAQRRRAVKAAERAVA